LANSATSSDNFHVTAIVVTHDGSTWLPQVVASLASQVRPIDHTVAVDTGSRDDSLKLLKNSRIEVINAPRNSGFGQAVDLAIAQLPTRKTDSEWLWFIHDDCAPDGQALAALLQAIETRPQVVMAGPKLRGWYDRSHLLEAGISIAGNGARWTGLESREYDQGQRDGIHEVLAVSTAGMLIRRDVYEEVGGFDPKLSLFRDDVDLGWRVRVAGHSVIVATDAIAYHAQAAASERRSVDVKSRFGNRPLLLDRRNAAYVLLVNSSLWMLPWLFLHLLGSSALRALGYLIAKLPGYASDEILAISLLMLKPTSILAARKVRKKHRLISSRVVSVFIPPRLSQARVGLIRNLDILREKVVPVTPLIGGDLDEVSEDEDLLTPLAHQHWSRYFRKPELLAFLFLATVTTLWSRHRFGSVSGGALPTTPDGAIDLWRRYADSWHNVGMGSSTPTPSWVLLLALGSTLFFGKAALFISVLLWSTPLLLMWSISNLLKSFTSNRWLIYGASTTFALSPIVISSINAGRLGTIATLIITPALLKLSPRFEKIENQNWQFIIRASLLIALLASFSPPAFALIACASLLKIVVSHRQFRRTGDRQLFLARAERLVTLVLAPIALLLPASFESLRHPSRLLLEPGFTLAGGGPNLAFLANGGGVGSIPWWFVSPVTFILLAALTSSTRARKFAEAGVMALSIATISSVITISGHGDVGAEKLWVGTWIAFATIESLVAGVIILESWRDKLAISHIHYRHILAGLVVLSTVAYSLAATMWLVNTGADSPVKANQESVLPAFLAVTPGVKTLVLRNSATETSNSLKFFIAHQTDTLLGDPDVAPVSPKEIDLAIEQMIDGSGLASSNVLALHGIKYVFMKSPVNDQTVRSIDGIGGFTRISSTDSGIVWRTSGVSERIVFTDSSNKRRAVIPDEFAGKLSVDGPGMISLAENYDRSWQVIKDGKRLVRSKSEFGLPQFQVLEAGEFSLIHDGTVRRGWLALEAIVFLTFLVLALPAGRRKREISVEELT